MNGSPFYDFVHGDLSADEIWAKLQSHDVEKDIMTTGTGLGVLLGSKPYECTTELNEVGLVCSHAYTTLGVTELETDDGTVRLVKVRNPHNTEYYTGNWSDYSNLWTPAYRKAVNEASGDAYPNDEGIFYMDIDTYKEYFGASVINQDTRGWSLDYFLMFDDPEKDIVTVPGCEDCTKHTLTVTNNGPEQEIYIGTHIWQNRTYGWSNKACQEAIWSDTDGHQMWYDPENEDKRYYFDATEGSVWTQPIKFEKDQTKEVAVVFDWGRKNVVKDWSLTAWGTKHGVTVRHENYPDVETEHMPQYTDHP